MSRPSREQHLVDVLGREVPDLRRLEQVDDLEARQRGLEAGALEIVGRAHGVWEGSRGSRRPRRAAAGYDSHRPGDPSPVLDADSSRPRPRVPRGSVAGGCAQTAQTVRDLHPDHHPVRRVQARHQPGQLHLAGHGRQAQGRPDQGAGADASLGTPLITSAFRDNRWDYVYEFQRDGPGARAPPVHRLLQGRRRSRAGKATRCRSRRRS